MSSVNNSSLAVTHGAGVHPEPSPNKTILLKRELSAYVFLIAGSWSAWQGLFLSLDTVNGRPWSSWNSTLLGGAACLLVGGLLTLLSKRLTRWGYGLSLLGALALTIFFAPATANTLKSYLSNTPEIYGTSDMAFALAAPFVVFAALLTSSLHVIGQLLTLLKKPK